MKMTLIKKFEFEAAHFLPEYDGACSNLHGHTYKLEVEISFDSKKVEKMLSVGANKEEYNRSNYHLKDVMGLDFKTLKEAVKKMVLNKFDHAFLNDICYIPTAELLASIIFNSLDEYFMLNMQEERVVLESIKLYETSDSCVVLKRE